jgi:hypothetical protein
MTVGKRSVRTAYLATRPAAEEQARQEDELVAEIRHIHDASRRACGAPGPQPRCSRPGPAPPDGGSLRSHLIW